jgi:hypothetical protein
MADPFSLTANIIAVTIAGFKVAKGLNTLADGIGSAGKEVRIYADEIDAFSKLLQRVKDLLHDTQSSRLPDSLFYEQSLLLDILGVCKRVLEPINRIQQKLTPLVGRFTDSTKGKNFALRIRWIFSSKEKLLFYRGALKEQHRLLNTTLVLMTFKTTKDSSPQNIWYVAKG